MIEAAASCAVLLLIVLGGIPLLRWRDRRNERVRLVRERNPGAIGVMYVPRHKVWQFAEMGWQYEADRPDLAAKLAEWEAARS